VLHIFISYSHADSHYARRLEKALNANGFQAWLDERINYGEEWPNAVRDALDQSDAVIVLMTPRAEKSLWVQNELTRALRKSKPLYPVLLAGESWLSVESIQHYDASDGQLPPAKFYDAIRHPTQSAPHPRPTTTSSRTRTKPVERTRIARAGAALLLVGMLVVVYYVASSARSSETSIFPSSTEPGPVASDAPPPVSTADHGSPETGEGQRGARQIQFEKLNERLQVSDLDGTDP